MVGTHNTIDVAVECQVHMGGCVGFFRKGGCRYLCNAVSIRGAPPRVLGMVNPSAHYRCPEACGGAFLPYGSPNDAYNTVDINVGAYNTVVTNVGTSHTVCVRSVVEHYSRRRTGYDPGIVV